MCALGPVACAFPAESRYGAIRTVAEAATQEAPWSTSRLGGHALAARLTSDPRRPQSITAPVKDPWGGTRRGTRARATIDRKAFGLTWNKALEAGGVAVGDDVSLDLEVELLEKRKT